MKICIMINGRPHEGGMTTLINNIAESFRDLGFPTDIISIFGKSQYRITKKKLTQKTDQFLENKPYTTLFTYLVSKLILLFHFLFNYFFNRYDLVIAGDYSTVNIVKPFKKIFKLFLIHYAVGGVVDLKFQKKIGDNDHSFVNKYFINEEIKANRYADLIVSTSFIFPVLYRDKEKTSPVLLAKSPINPKIFRPDEVKRKNTRSQLSLTDDQFMILFVGRLVTRKGAVYPVKALKEIVKTNTNCRLIYIGDGPEKEKIEKFANENNLNPYLKLISSVPNQEIPDYYRAADAMFFTSINEYGFLEAFSLVPLEAMACGLPVIAFDNNRPYTENPLRHQDTCLLARPEDPKSLAEQALRLINDKCLVKELTNKAKEEIDKEGWATPDVIKSILNEVKKVKENNKKSL